MINWKTYNQELIKRGEILIERDFFSAEQDKTKKRPGRPKEYPDSLIIFTLIIKFLTRFAYRQLQGYLSSLFAGSGFKVPNFRTIHYIIDFYSLPDNVEKAQSKGKKLEKVFADKGYDTHEIFNKLKQKGIVAGIIPRKSARIRGDSARDSVVRKLRRMGIRKYKEEIGYGKRNVVENFFSVFKRRFGEYVDSRKWENIRAEIMFKVFIVNSFKRGCLWSRELKV